MKKVFNCAKNNLLLIILALQPVLDILAYAQRGMSVSFAGYFRLGLTVLVPIYTLFFAKERKKFIIAMSVIAAFCALHILNGFRVGYLNLVLDVKYMLLVIHALVICYSFMFLYEKEELLRQIKSALLVIIPTIAVTYYLSYFLKSGNYTYVDAQIGWTGWSVTTSVYSVIVSALFPFMVYFCINSGKKWQIIFLVPLAFMYVMNGTKAAYLTLICTVLANVAFIIIEFFVQKKKKFPVVVSSLLSVMLVLSIAYYNYSPRLNIDMLNEENLQNNQEILSENDPALDEEPETEEPSGDITDYLDKMMIKRFGKDRVLKAYEGNLTAEGLSDNRLRKILFASLVWDESDTLTKFVGFEQAKMYVGDYTYDLESDPQAIYFYYGYIGAALLGAVIIYFWLRLLKQLLFHFKESFNLFNFAIFINYALLMISAVFTGHLLRRPNSAIYLAVVLLLIYCRTEPLLKKKKRVEENENEKEKCN